MDKKEKAKETVQPEITVEQVKDATAGESSVTNVLNQQIEDLQNENKTLKENLEILKGVNEKQALQISELSDVVVDTKSNRKENKKGEVQIKFLLSPAGKFLLPYNVGQVVWHNANQADEMVELKYAEYVK